MIRTTATTLALSFLLALPAHAAVRHGVVLELAPIENRGADENPEVEKRREVGRGVASAASMGVMVAGHRLPGRLSSLASAAGLVAPAVGEKVAEKMGGPGPTTRYMIKVRLDNKKVLSITQLRGEIAGVEVGSRVDIEGTGSNAHIVSK